MKNSTDYDMLSARKLEDSQNANIGLLVESSTLAPEEVMAIVFEITEIERELTLREGE